MSTVHVYPNDDAVEHFTDGSDCLCDPDIEVVTSSAGNVGLLVIHHSLDGREFGERGESVPQEPNL